MKEEWRSDEETMSMGVRAINKVTSGVFEPSQYTIRPSTNSEPQVSKCFTERFIFVRVTTQKRNLWPAKGIFAWTSLGHECLVHQ